MKSSTTPWNIQSYLKTEEDVVNYLEAAFDDGDLELINVSINDANIFLSAIENPPEPSERLKNAMARYQSKNNHGQRAFDIDHQI
jgi:uncharacterized protein (DUF1778 family)